MRSVVVLILVCIGCGSCTSLTGQGPREAQISSRVCNYDSELDSSSNFVERETSVVIDGDTSDQLLTSLRSLITAGAPNDYGSTNWLVRWDFDWRVASTGCKITSAASVAEIDYRFPVWPQQLSVNNRSLVERWTLYSDDLRARHCRYGEFGIQAAVAVEQALVSIAPRKSCSRLEADANELARSIVGRYQLLERNFKAQAIVNQL